VILIVYLIVIELPNKKQIKKIKERVEKFWAEIYNNNINYIFLEEDEITYKKKICENLIKIITNKTKIDKKIVNYDKACYTYIIVYLNSVCSTKIPIPTKNQNFSFKLYQRFVKTIENNRFCDLNSSVNHYLNSFFYNFKQKPEVFLKNFLYKRELLHNKNLEIGNIEYEIRKRNKVEIKKKVIYNNLDQMYINILKLKDILLPEFAFTGLSPLNFVATLLTLYFRNYEDYYIFVNFVSSYFKVCETSIRQSIKLMKNKLIKIKNPTDSFIHNFINKLKENKYF